MSIDELLKLVKKKEASDLLISAGAPPVLRIHGRLVPAAKDILTQDQTKKLIYGVLNEAQRKHFEERKELDLSFQSNDDHRFRVNVYLQRGSVTAAFRPIPDEPPDLDTLGLPPVVSELVNAKQGLLLVTGPTGHGKTTTQAAMIHRINSTRDCHIITVEDPIEFVHKHRKSLVDQREIGQDTLGFHDALKYVLRQAPDVILVGEMRDLETIQAALRAAETGHLVLGTLHTNDSIQTVDRVIDVFPGAQQQQIRFMLSMTLLAVISQRLIPRADGNGRVLAVEVLRNNTAIGNLIREGQTHQVYSVLETSSKGGMVTMDKSVKELYLRGAITYDEAVGHVRDVKSIMNVSH